jgi:hypothetical protein
MKKINLWIVVPLTKNVGTFGKCLEKDKNPKTYIQIAF